MSKAAIVRCWIESSAKRFRSGEVEQNSFSEHFPLSFLGIVLFGLVLV